MFLQTVTSSFVQTLKWVTTCSSRQRITLGKCKTKTSQADLGIFSHIPAYSDIFRHNQTYPEIIQAYSEPCVILAYSEPCYIQNLGIFTTWRIFGTLAYSNLKAYSEPCQISTMERFATIVNGYNYFRNMSFLHFPHFMK